MANRPRLPIAASVALLLMSVSTAVRAQPSVRLVYDVGQEAGCPSESDLRALVAARLGEQPYTQEGAWAVHVRVRREGLTLEADVELLGPDGTVRGRRAVASEGDCATLISSVALTLSLVHEVVREDERPTEQTTQGTDVPSPPTEAVPSLEDQGSESAVATVGTAEIPPLRWWLGGGPAVVWGLVPGATVGWRLGTGLGGPRGELRVSFRADHPRAVAHAEHTHRLGWVLASLAGCGRWGALRACASARVNVAYVPRRSLGSSGARPSVGGAFGVELGSRLWGRARSELRGYISVALPVSRLRVSVDGVEVFRQRPVDVSTGVELLWGRP